jgi:hypothetical protein
MEPFVILENVLHADERGNPSFEPENIGLPKEQKEAHAGPCPLMRAERIDRTWIEPDSERQDAEYSSPKTILHP